MERRITRRNTRRRSRTLAWFSIINLVLLVILYMAESRVAERHWFGTAITYAPQHFFGVPALLLLIWAVLRKNKRMVALNLLAIAFFGSVLLGYCVPWRAAWQSFRTSKADEIRLRVMTYNIHHSQSGGTLVADEVRKADPHIICLQEANAVLGWSSAMSEIRGFKGKWYLVDYGELAIFSRFPILSHEVCQMENLTGRVLLKVVLDVDGHRVTVVNAHLNSSLRPRGMSGDKNSIPEVVDNASELRSIQLPAVMNATLKANTPLILAGDFNTPPRGRVYNRIASDLHDSFRTAGWGLGYTFRSDVPVMRIDYIFLGGGARATKCSVPLTNASDHLPVVAEVAIAR